MSYNKSYVKQLLTLLIAITITSLNAQIVGEGRMITKTIDLENIYKFESNFYADITIDMAEQSGITITAEENIINFIDVEMKRGSLIIGQKEWIEPSKRIKVVVGAPKLCGILMGTHDDLKVLNVKGDIFNVDAEIGSIILSGQVDDLRITAKNGEIDASELLSRVASVEIFGDGEAMLNVTEKINCNLSENARFVNKNRDIKTDGCQQKESMVASTDTRYIDLKIKNNSWTRNHFVVVGPKPDGRSFSYGFPMMPGTTKSELWTVGTKIYKENSIGQRNLLVTLTANDEGKTVNLFD